MYKMNITTSQLKKLLRVGDGIYFKVNLDICRVYSMQYFVIVARR